MGVSEYGKICPTDGLDSRECPGYFGHIELMDSLSLPLSDYHSKNIKMCLYPLWTNTY